MTVSWVAPPVHRQGGHCPEANGLRPILSCQNDSGYHGVGAAQMIRSQDSSNTGVRADMATPKRIKAFCDEARRMGAFSDEDHSGPVLLFVLTVAGAALRAAEENPFDAQVLNVRPRVFLRNEPFEGLTIEKLRARIDEPEFAGARQKWRARPMGRGLLWMLEGKKEDLDAAISGLARMDADGGTWSDRGLALVQLATLFDWLYQELDESTRAGDDPENRAGRGRGRGPRPWRAGPVLLQPYARGFGRSVRRRPRAQRREREGGRLLDDVPRVRRPRVLPGLPMGGRSGHRSDLHAQLHLCRSAQHLRRLVVRHGSQPGRTGFGRSRATGWTGSSASISGTCVRDSPLPTSTTSSAATGNPTTSSARGWTSPAT